MRLTTSPLFAVGFAALMATSAPAQQMAQSVLDQYIGDMRAAGMTVTPGNATSTSNSVELTNIEVSDASGLTYTIAFVRAEEIGGDKVQLFYPEAFDMSIDADGEQPAMDIAVRLSGIEHIVSGAVESRQHDVKAAGMDFTAKSADGTVDMTFGLGDFISQTTRTDGAVPNHVGKMKAASLTVKQRINDGFSNILTDITYNNLTLAVDVDTISEDKIEELFNGARNLKLTYGAESGQGVIDINNSDFNGVVDMTYGAAGADISVQDGIASFVTEGRDASYTVKMKDLPFPPFQASMDTVAMTFSAPLKKTDETVPAAIKMSIGGLKASDTIWGMIDPAGTIPRDAANLNIDLTANMKWLVDLMQAADQPAPPVEVESVDINDVTLEIGGAAFNGKGSAILDNTQMPPMPIGSVDLDLKGGLGLIDKLVGIGVLPEQQAQMAKMMSGMFTLPGGDGPDHLTSKIEMKEDGAILANGQRLQ